MMYIETPHFLIVYAYFLWTCKSYFRQFGVHQASNSSHEASIDKIPTLIENEKIYSKIPDQSSLYYA